MKRTVARELMAVLAAPAMVAPNEMSGANGDHNALALGGTK